eukprot:CAMPEP_0172724444 /NCGR_PEP_ID=MMETSP1074-20121228/86012_1 /TAXON_ID=2916 /ORGANISM="Ceratium fusus, Strain PA161109" /LENGTH=200 /DNA_ID=CAMNT_0013550925 /DNA_START=32 /DNA_END=632 /DNA_ORIENTATION=-
MVGRCQPSTFESIRRGSVPADQAWQTGAFGHSPPTRMSGALPVDEHIPAAGAEPQDGDSIWMQVRKGPHNMVMFFSCIGFAVPALVHLYMHRCLADYIAAFGLLCVTCTSTLCDVFCIHYGVYDDGQHNINEDGNNNNNDSAASEKSPAGSDIHTFASKSDSSSGSYGKAASAVAMRNSFVQNLIDDTDSPCEVVAPDKW